MCHALGGAGDNMKKIIIASMLLSLTLLIACQPKACTLEAKVCPDGSTVGRSGPNCEFPECPAQVPNPASVFCREQGGKLEIVEGAEGQQGVCVLADGTRCDEWEYYRGECPSEKSDDKNYCTAESREGEFCTKEYRPVCGWFNESIKCVAYPCAITASNPCEACQNKQVDYWTEGECPKA